MQAEKPGREQRGRQSLPVPAILAVRDFAFQALLLLRSSPLIFEHAVELGI